MKRRYITVALCIFSLLILVCFLKPGHATVVIRNTSSSNILGGQLRVGDRVYEVKPLKRGVAQRIDFWYLWANEYKVSIQTDGGHLLEPPPIYLARRADFKDALILSDSGLTIDRGAGPVKW